MVRKEHRTQLVALSSQFTRRELSDMFRIHIATVIYIQKEEGVGYKPAKHTGRKRKANKDGQQI